MIHGLFKQDVYLRPEDHRYFDNEGKEYVSFTKLFSLLAPKFDAEYISGFVAKKEGSTKQDVLDKWDKQRDEGCRIDDALDLFCKTGQILDSNKDLEPIIKTILQKYNKYHSCHEQVVVYSKKYGCAGMIDKLSITSKLKTSAFHISDFKRFEGGMTYEPKGQRYLNYPFEHMVNSRYNKITIQLTYYGMLFEELTGRKCDFAFIDLIVPEGDGHINQMIPVQYLRPQMEIFLEHYKDKIRTLLQPEPQTVQGYEHGF